MGAGVAVRVFNLRHAGVAVAGPEIFQRPTTTGRGVSEIRNVRGGIGRPLGETLGEPGVVLRGDVGVGALLFAAGDFHGPIRERIISELEFEALGFTFLRSAGAKAAVVVERQFDQVVDFLLVSRVVDGIDGVGVPVRDRDDVVERAAGGDAVADTLNGTGPGETGGRIRISQTGEQRASGAGALILALIFVPV